MKKLILVLTLFVISNTNGQTKLYNKVKKYLDEVSKEYGTIPDERKLILNEIGEYILESKKLQKTVQLVFICTHNSRRSQFGQVWGMTAAEYFGVDGINFYSGGTEATAFNPRAIDALTRVGFNVTKGAGGDDKNPKYMVNNKKTDTPWLMYSKKYNDKQNPQTDFAAIMVCSEADKSCPLVDGSNYRVSLPFNDPKFYDNTPSEKLKYDETCRLIAREMLYTFEYVKKQMILNLEKK